MASRNRGEFELLLRQEVDDRVVRLNCAPAIRRNNGLRLHNIYDHKGLPRQVIVLRMWEASLLKEYLPPRMWVGNQVYHTGKWESIPLGWAFKNIQDDCQAASSPPWTQDAKRPQCQLNGGESSRSYQDDYPVWYFLTGQIARSDKLKALWKLENTPYGRLATVYGLKHVQDRHCEGLVQSSKVDEAMGNNKSDGVAYFVKNKLAEDRLRFFKTCLFRVIRCKIVLHPVTKYGQPHKMDGLTFIVCQGEAVIHAMANSPTAQALGAVDSRCGSLASTSSTAWGFDLEPSTRLDEHTPAVLEDTIDEGTRSDENPEHNRLKFPVLRETSKCDAWESASRREWLMSPSRPRSRLSLVENASSIAYPSESTPNRSGEKILYEANEAPGPENSHQQSVSMTVLEEVES
jgi:hypothetical protein